MKGQVTEYSESTKLSMTLMSSKVVVSGLSIRQHNVAVISVWPCAPLSIGMFLSRARKEGCVVTPCHGMKYRESILFCGRNDIANVMVGNLP